MFSMLYPALRQNFGSTSLLFSRYTSWANSREDVHPENNGEASPKSCLKLGAKLWAKLTANLVPCRVSHCQAHDQWWTQKYFEASANMLKMPIF
jgi:hypothetical protein